VHSTTQTSRSTQAKRETHCPPSGIGIRHSSKRLATSKPGADTTNTTIARTRSGPPTSKDRPGNSSHTNTCRHLGDRR
jgi:hypothetical protein